jgi:hypothetical protein
MPDDPTKNGTDDDGLAAEDYQEQVRIFQDETVTDDHVLDPIAIEQQGENDDPVNILGVPPQILKEELDKRAFDGTGEPSGAGEPRTDANATMYEGTESTGGDVYNAQEDAFDQASDKLEDQEGEDDSRNA